MKQTTIAASEFKAKCLGLLDEVAAQGSHITITKRGHPIARLIPVADPKRSSRGTWKGIVKIKGDLVHFHDDWGPED